MSVELDGANNVVKTDTVSEVTSANGVTIDGLSIKDSKLVTANSVIEANMSANSVDSDSYVDGSIDTVHIADLNVTTGKIAADAITAAKIADNAVVTAGINADAVTGAKIADDAINSEHYTDGSIDTAHIADGQITVGKLATALFTGATDIGAAIVDADLFLMDDGAGGTIRKTAASRLKTYAAGGGKVLQYVIATNSAEGTNGTTTFAATGLTLDITPTDSNSKMVIIAQDSYKAANDGSTNASGREAIFAIFKASSVLNDTQATVGRTEISASTSTTPTALGTVTLIGTETAGSTSERTYKLMVKTNGAAVASFNESGHDSFMIALELE